MCFDPSTEANRRRSALLLPGSRIEHLHTHPNDVAVNYSRRRRHPAARVVTWLLVMRLAALCWTVMRMPAVLLDPQWLERHRNRLWLRTAERRGGNAACQGTRPSIRSLVGAPLLANALSNRTTEILRRENSRRLSRGRAPPVLPSRRCTTIGQIRHAATSQKQSGGTAQEIHLRTAPSPLQ